MEMGTGKTYVTLMNAALLWWTGKIDRMLVVGPNGPHRIWLDELPKHMPEDIPRTTVLYRSTCTPKQWETMLQVLNHGKGLMTLLMNYEAFKSDKGYDVAAAFLRGGQSLMVLDEAHRIKSPGADRTKKLISLGQYAVYRRILSGGLTPQGLEDLYAPFKFLHWGIIGEHTFTGFKARYCLMGGYERRQVTGYINQDELLAKIAPYAYSATRAECLTLAPPDYVTVKVDLSPEQERAYVSLKRDFAASLPSGQTYAVELGVKRLGKLHQITSGHLRLDDGTVVKFPRNPKAEALVELVQNTQDKVLVWCAFKLDVEAVLEALRHEKIGAAAYYGGYNDDKNEAELRRWRSDPTCQVLVLTRDKGGEGLTLNEAPIAINYSFSFKFAPWEQALARNYRDGQTQHVTYYNLVAYRTVDTRILKVLGLKQDVTTTVRNHAAFRDWLEGPVDEASDP